MDYYNDKPLTVQIKQKQCATCGTLFGCTNTEKDGSCWCDGFPPIFSPDDGVDCLCPGCLKKAVIKKIEEYTQKLSPEDAPDNIAKNLPKTTKQIEGIDYYMENGYLVFTPWFHLKRGYCCGSGCRHCPYK